MNLINLQKFANKLYIYKIPVVPKIIYYLQFILFNSSVPSKIIKTDTKMSDYV